jgi:hypothetical protein
MTKRTRGFRLALASVLTSACVFACSGWDPSKPFEREAPQVKEAIDLYDGGDAASAEKVLEDYLLTGHCAEGNIGTPNRLNERPNGTFDFGLVLFKIGEAYGARFGDEETDGGGVKDPNPMGKGLRSGVVECALRIVRRVAEDATQPVALRARARYLEGNLLFLMGTYEEAVTAYDKSLALAPGMGDAGPTGVPDGSQAAFTPDPVGRDAAWNRAIALRRIDDKKDAGNDSGADGGDGASGDAAGEGGNGDSGGNDGGDSGKNDDKDNNKDGGNNNDDKDSGKDSGGDPPPKPDPKDPPDAGQAPQQPPPPSRQSQDERILDQLENAPTVQQEAARKAAGRRRAVPGMADK